MRWYVVLSAVLVVTSLFYYPSLLGLALLGFALLCLALPRLAWHGLAWLGLAMLCSPLLVFAS